jgi:hypothetical protein
MPPFSVTFREKGVHGTYVPQFLVDRRPKAVAASNINNPGGAPAQRRNFMRSLLVASVFALGIVGPVFAGSYSTPLLFASESAGSQGFCCVSNVGTTPVNVTVTAYGAGGAVLTQGGNTCVTIYGGVLPAGASCCGNGYLFHFRCTVDASSNKVRVDAWVTDGSGNITSALPGT